MSAKPLFLVPLVVLVLAAIPSRAAEPAPRLDRKGDANEPNHVISSETAYYTTGPQQGRPADGKLPAGTKVRLLRKAGSYSLVQTASGVTAYVATDVLRSVAPEKPLVVSDDVRAAAKSGNVFAFDLYGRLREGEGNLFLSPASISTAMAMTYAGAAGETERQMAAVLHFDLLDERLHAAYGTLGQILNAGAEGYQLRMANRLWSGKGYPFQQSFLTLTRKTYGAELSQLDFARSEEARRTINGWVEQQTNDRIQDLIPPNVLTSDTRLVLTNAIYFKGDWVEEFRKKATHDEPFHLAGGGEVAAPLMRQTEDFLYAEADGLQVLELPYVGGDLSMLILLPKAGGLAGVERSLTAKNFERWTSKLARREVELYLPRFKIEAAFRLNDTLSAMGMPLAFSDDADFSGMSPAEALKISEVIHKAFVEVNEQGTEAAAATAVIALPTAAPPGDEEPPVVFRADRPFVFLIRDGRTGAVLFLGRIVDPTK